MALRYEPADSLIAQIYLGFSAYIGAWHLGTFLHRREELYFYERCRYDPYAEQGPAYYQAVPIHKHIYLYTHAPPPPPYLQGVGASLRNTLESVVLSEMFPDKQQTSVGRLRISTAQLRVLLGATTKLCLSVTSSVNPRINWYTISYYTDPAIAIFPQSPLQRPRLHPL